MGVGLIGIVVLGGGLLVLGIFGILIVTRLFKRDGSSTPVARGVTLKCPHCGETTEASRHECLHCSKEL